MSRNYFHQFQINLVPNRHCNFSRETGKREICRREISHGKIRREKREIVKSKIRVFWPKLKWKYKKTHVIFFCFSFQMCIFILYCWFLLIATASATSFFCHRRSAREYHRVCVAGILIMSDDIPQDCIVDTIK